MNATRFILHDHHGHVCRSPGAEPIIIVNKDNNNNNKMANLTEEKYQKSGKKNCVVCCLCRSTFVASLLKNPLLSLLYCLFTAVLNK